MKKIFVIGIALLALCVCISAVSADDGWSFNWSSSESSNSDGGEMSFENGKLKLQGLEFTIPDGYKENEKVKKLGEKAEDIENAKYSVCAFDKDKDEIVVKVFWSDDELTNLTDPNGENKTINGINGLIVPNEYGDNNPTFKGLKDGKLVMVTAPDEATIESVLK